jgi:energy-coupling factor transporter ATP-binding protein EcfA2
VPKAQIEAKVTAAATLLRLGELLQRKPTQLSGGQRQRVAIGRAIVREPKLFLFDEPLSNLDAELRVSMRSEIRDLHARLKATMIYVTHDQVEAMTMADKIVVLRAGKVEQVGAPLELYNHPVNTFVAGFIGSPRMNFLPVGCCCPMSQGPMRWCRPAPTPSACARSTRRSRRTARADARCRRWSNWARPACCWAPSVGKDTPFEDGHQRPDQHHAAATRCTWHAARPRALFRRPGAATV